MSESYLLIKTIMINEDKLNQEIEKLEEKRDEHHRMSAEWIEIDDQIEAISKIINKCTIKQQ